MPPHLQHHCRRCGKIVCNNCSTKRLLLASQSSEPVRVCDPCFAEASAKRISDVKPDSSGDDDSDDNTANNRQVLRTCLLFNYISSCRNFFPVISVWIITLWRLMWRRKWLDDLLPSRIVLGFKWSMSWSKYRLKYNKNCVLGSRRTLYFHPLHPQPTWTTRPGGYLSLTMTYPILRCSYTEELTAFIL